jgi:hypothetical protein
MVVTDIFSAMRAGKELANAETWKRAQLRTAAIVALLSAGVGIAKAFGIDIRLTPEEINSIAIVIGLVGGLFMGVATLVSSTRIGLPSRGDVLPDGRSDTESDGGGGGTTGEENRGSDGLAGSDASLDDQVSDLRDMYRG